MKKIILMLVVATMALSCRNSETVVEKEVVVTKESNPIRDLAKAKASGAYSEAVLYNNTLKNLQDFFVNNEIGKQTDGCHLYYGKNGYAQANSTEDLMWIVGIKDFFPKIVGYTEYWKDFKYRDYTKVTDITQSLAAPEAKFSQNEYYGYVTKKQVLDMKPQ